MKILAIEKDVYGIESSAFTTSVLKEEAMAAWKYYANGTFRELYFTESNNAVIILESRNKVEAEAILKTLPLVKAGLIDFEIHELRNYDGFSRLFG